MDYLKRIFRRRGLKAIRLNLPVSLILIALASAAATIAMFGFQPTSIMEIWECVKESGYMIALYNWLPVVLAMLVLYFASNSAALACGLVGAAVSALSIVNRNMINMRQDPFKPNDILLGGEFLGIAKSISKSTFLAVGAGAFLFLLVFTLSLILIRNKPMNLIARLTGAAASLGILLAVNSLVLASPEIYASLFMKGNIYNQTDNFQSKGFLYSFIYTMDNSRVKKPYQYDKDAPEIAKLLGAERADSEHVLKPNIILILSEAYSDMISSPHLDFSNYADPMKNFKKLKEESISGYIVVPNVGGGTSDTEFDIFTGMNSRHFRGAPYAYSLIAKPISAMPSVLSFLGYDNIAIHPGFGWFYNRQNVYGYMGFSRLIDIESFDKTDTKGMYVTEEQTINKIISEYEEHMRSAPEKPFFEFCVTIQNHGPYLDKYGDSELNFSSDLNFTKNEENALYNYIYGMLDCDRELGVLTDYLRNRPEPVVLVYYGDHLPSFEKSIYEALIPHSDDPAEELIRLYKTPFLIWQNDSAKKASGIDAIYEEMSIEGDWTFSSSRLGAAVNMLLGFAGSDPFIDEANVIYESYPVIFESQYVTASGSVELLGEKDEHPINFYRSWEYYNIYNEKQQAQ
ncbi:MAG: LTA synthase family protein [Clostridiales bacterium]|jgi:phosphoglycerol transferase MdoB-like AlkP superfamily enzyme|nr:LTA synthase family protein [Clostridiales bacterium]